ncbi:MAG: tetratricopeptide repeat protein, partial [Fusobacteriaceae bacterium]
NSFENNEKYTLLRGMNLSQEGKYLEAIRELNLARARNPENIMVLRELAFVYGNIGEIKNSTKIYEEILKIDAKDSVAIKNLAYIYYIEKNIELAENFLEKLPEKEDDYFTTKLKGLIFAQQNNNEQAYNYLSSSNNMNDNYDEELFTEYLKVMLKLDRKDEGYKFLDDKARTFYGDKSFVLLYSKSLTINFNEIKKSEKIIKKYLAEKGSDDEVIIMLAKNLILQKRNEEATETLSMISMAGTHGSEYKFIINEVKKNKEQN